MRMCQILQLAKSLDLKEHILVFPKKTFIFRSPSTIELAKQINLSTISFFSRNYLGSMTSHDRFISRSFLIQLTLYVIYFIFIFFYSVPNFISGIYMKVV